MQDNWIDQNVVLTGECVRLVPLERAYFEGLITLAKEPRIWEFYVLDGTDTAVFMKRLEEALTEREAGRQYPFVIVDKANNALIGSTRFIDMQPAHRKLEIGWTWMHPDHWATGVNTECKMLLLEYCFEQLKAVRVQLKTDALNLRSRRAIEKIGGIYEGILRHDMLRDNGTNRDSAYYSILDNEWELVKAGLRDRLRGTR